VPLAAMPAMAPFRASPSPPDHLIAGPSTDAPGGGGGLTGLSHDCAAFPAAPDADMMAPGSRGGDVPLRSGYHRRDSA
jgi:hypothetical protein